MLILALIIIVTAFITHVFPNTASWMKYWYLLAKKEIQTQQLDVIFPSKECHIWNGPVGKGEYIIVIQKAIRF